MYLYFYDNDYLIFLGRGRVDFDKEYACLVYSGTQNTGDSFVQKWTYIFSRRYRGEKAPIATDENEKSIPL